MESHTGQPDVTEISTRQHDDVTDDDDDTEPCRDDVSITEISALCAKNEEVDPGDVTGKSNTDSNDNLYNTGREGKEELVHGDRGERHDDVHIDVEPETECACPDNVLPAEVTVIKNLDYTKSADQQIKRIIQINYEQHNPGNHGNKLCCHGNRSLCCHGRHGHTIDLQTRDDDVLGKTKLDLYLPRVPRDPPGRGRCTREEAPPSPVPGVLFFHGGGWRRGHKHCWQHYLSRYATNFLAAAMDGVSGEYGNIGRGLAARGIPCAVLTYPLSRVRAPWCLLELLQYLLSSLLLLTPLLAPGVLALDAALGTAARTPLLLTATLGATQLLTLVTMVMRRRYYGLGVWGAGMLVLGLGLGVLLQGALLYVSGRAGWLGYTASLTLTLGVQGALVVQYVRLPLTPYSRQIQAVTESISWVRGWAAASHTFHPDHIFLAGHSSGGHLVTMATINSVTGRNALTGIKGLISISGVYDIPGLSGGIVTPLFVNPAFGFDEEAWVDSSPVHQLRKLRDSNPTGAKLPPVFLINARFDLNLDKQADELHDVLLSCGTSVSRAVINWTDHTTITSCFRRKGFRVDRKCAEFVTSVMKGEKFVPEEEEEV